MVKNCQHFCVIRQEVGIPKSVPVKIHIATVNFRVTFNESTQQMRTILSFSPTIAGGDSKRWKGMTLAQRALQNYIANIASKVMDELEKK